MNEQYEVHCNRCNWWGYKSQLKLLYKPDTVRIAPLGCPACLSDKWLEYKEEDTERPSFSIAWLSILAKRRDVLKEDLEKILNV